MQQRHRLFPRRFGVAFFGLKISSFTDMTVLEDERLRLLVRIALSDVGPDSRNGRIWNVRPLDLPMTSWHFG